MLIQKHLHLASTLASWDFQRLPFRPCRQGKTFQPPTMDQTGMFCWALNVSCKHSKWTGEWRARQGHTITKLHKAVWLDNVLEAKCFE